MDLGAVKDSLAGHRDTKIWLAPVVTKELKKPDELRKQLEEATDQFDAAKRVDEEQFAPARGQHEEGAVVEAPADPPDPTA